MSNLEKSILYCAIGLYLMSFHVSILEWPAIVMIFGLGFICACAHYEKEKRLTKVLHELLNNEEDNSQK